MMTTATPGVAIRRYTWAQAATQRSALRIAIQQHRDRYPKSTLGVARREGEKRQKGWAGPKDLFNAPLTHPLRDWLLSVMPEPVEDLDAWGFVLERGDRVKRHSHIRSHRGGENAWAGVYYVSLPIGSGRFMTDLVSVRSDKLGTTAPEAEEGTALIFPAYLEHWVTEHQADLPRISIAWNARAAT